MRKRMLLVSSVAVALALVGAMPASATFPGSNGRIAFGRPWERVFTMRPDGTHVARVAPDAGALRHPVWSPDGTELAMFRVPRGSVRMRLAIFDLATDAWSTVAKGGSLLTGFDTNSLAWSPDGTHLVVGAINSLGNTNLFTMATDGTDLVRLSARTRFDFSPAWSNDGTRIAFVSFNDKGKRELVIANADGSNRTVIPDGGARYQPYAPNWSPDDATIAFERWDSKGTTDIVLVDVGSGTLSPLTSTRHRWEREPVFSPDGTAVAYVRKRRSYYSDTNVFTVPATGGRPTQLTATPHVSEDLPSWQPRPV